MIDLHAERRRRLAGSLTGEKLDAIAVSHPPNIRYLTGFTGSNALLLVKPSRSILYTDPRYSFQAHEQCSCPVRTVSNGSLWSEAAKDVARRGIHALGVDDEHTSQAEWQRVAQALGRETRLKPFSGRIETLRTRKSPEEIELIRRSVRLCSKAFERVLRRIHLGITELDVAADLDHQMRKLGADGPAFETIVAFAERSALPHAKPTTRKIDHNQLLLVDMGASLNGYASDMTRVVHIGPPSDRSRRLYDAVLEAQIAAISAVRPGALGCDVDAAARKVLKKYGMDRAFLHSTGHGLGLEIHENPRLGKKSDAVLETGMTITIEPGAYIEGVGGVRIEDTVLVTGTGVEVLTPTTKELVVIEP